MDSNKFVHGLCCTFSSAKIKKALGRAQYSINNIKRYWYAKIQNLPAKGYGLIQYRQAGAIFTISPNNRYETKDF